MNYYRSQSNWGTPSYQIAAPPQPTYVPQPNWSGRQYYNAQMGSGGMGRYYDEYEDRDDGFFDNVWSRIKDVFSAGMGREEAKHWHRRVYGGLVPMDTLNAAQLGGAAGYEAIRHWTTYGSAYRSPLADDKEREREALAGLAVGEAQKLLSYSGHLMRHKSTRREAAEIAAITAERIYDEDFGGDPYDAYESSPRRRRQSQSFARRRSTSFGYGAGAPVLASSTGSSYSSRPLTQTLTGGGYGARPLSQAITGGTYVSAQPTGVSYVSPGQQIIPAATSAVSYAAAQPTYVTSTGQRVQYVSAGQGYGQQYGQQYAQPQYVQAQPTYASAGGQTYVMPGQQVAYASQPVGYGGQQYAQPQYVQASGASYGYPQQQAVTYVQPAQQYGAAQGYQRARALSTGYSVIR